MIGQCGYCGGWHTSPEPCPAVPNNAGTSQPLGDWRDAEIERLRHHERLWMDAAEGLRVTNDELRRELAEARGLLRKADPLEHCATGCDYCTQVSAEIAAFLASGQPTDGVWRCGCGDVLLTHIGCNICGMTAADKSKGGV